MGHSGRADPAPGPAVAHHFAVNFGPAPDGVLTTFDGKRMLVAIPADTPNLPRGAETVLREIDGRPYLIFPR